MAAIEMTVGEALVHLLQEAGVDTVFGIPGVHTIELYRGLAASGIRHITPRHEQGAAFMADGYARATGRPGVCILITGPGFANTISAMAQARADSIPMLVISGVNPVATLGRGHGLLHELPDQAAMSRTIALQTHTLTEPERLPQVLAEAWVAMMQGRRGPVHIEIPTDVMSRRIALPVLDLPEIAPPAASEAEIAETVERAGRSHRPLIVAGGGAVGAAPEIRALAEALDAPVITTVNARGLMTGHPLDLPASPSLLSVREVIGKADFVLALGTEFGQTDFDMYVRGAMPLTEAIVRVDIDAAQLAHHPEVGLAIRADSAAFASALRQALPSREARDGAARAAAGRAAALEEIGPGYRALVDLVGQVWQVLPEATIVGDSTQWVYAGNLWLEASRPGAWFNSATGFGTLGYGAPAAIGAALGAGGRPVVCVTGDGGLQFSLAELGAARDCGADVAFIVWNNEGYQEIETAMVEAQISPVGVTPSAPDFVKIAEAYGLPARRVDDAAGMAEALAALPRPCVIEYVVQE